MSTLPWHRPSIGEAEIAEVVDTLRSGWLTTGPKVERLEQAVRELVGAEAAFATTSATAALHLALLATGAGPGRQVITTGMTFCASVNVIEQVGADPVLVDVEPDTLNIDPERVAAAVTPATSAILVVHYGGHPAEMARLQEIAQEHSLIIIEDAAHALGASYRGQPIGSIGALTAFSFYANKNITTGEGGMLVGQANLVEKARLYGRHGIDRSVWGWGGSRGAASYDVVYPGLKYNMSDILAAIGIHQLAQLPEFVARRSWIASTYTARLSNLAGIALPTHRPEVEHAWHLYPIRVGPGPGLTRDELAEALGKRGVGTSVHFHPVADFSHYRRLLQPEDMQTTLTAGSELLSLPCYPAMTDDDVELVIKSTQEVLAEVS